MFWWGALWPSSSVLVERGVLFAREAARGPVRWSQRWSRRNAVSLDQPRCDSLEVWASHGTPIHLLR